MYERGKKKFARLYACVMLLLSAMLLLVSSIPVVRMELGGERSEWFRNGSYTGSMKDMPGELQPDMDTAVRAWRYMGELRQIVRLQTIEAEIRQIESRIEDADEAVRAELEASLTKLREERESAASPEQEEALHRLTSSEKLNDLLCAWDAYVLPSDFGAEEYTGQLSAILTALRAAALLAYLTFAACFPVFAAVWLIAKAIDLLLHYKKLGKPELQRLSVLHACFAYAFANLAFLLVFTLIGLRPGYRPESIVWLVALTALACVLNAVCRSVFAEEPKEGFWLRQGLRALSLAASAAAVCAFISLGLPTLFLEHANDFGAGYAQSIAEQAGATTGAFDGDGPAAQAAGAVGRAAAIVFVVSGAAVLAMAYLLARGTRRFAFWKPVRARCALGITASGGLVLLLIAIPVYLGAGSVEEQSRAGREGEFRVLLDAYRVEGSEENLLYRSRTEERQELEASIAQMEEAIRSSTGEDTLRIIAEKESLQTRLAETEAALDDLRTHRVRDLSIGIAGTAAALIAEIVSWRITKRTQRTATP